MIPLTAWIGSFLQALKVFVMLQMTIASVCISCSGISSMSGPLKLQGDFFFLKFVRLTLFWKSKFVKVIFFSEDVLVLVRSTILQKFYSPFLNYFQYIKDFRDSIVFTNERVQSAHAKKKDAQNLKVELCTQLLTSKAEKFRMQFSFLNPYNGPSTILFYSSLKKFKILTFEQTTFIIYVSRRSRRRTW